MESSTNNVADTILQQFGGNRFVAMTGAKQMVSLEDGIQFKLGRGAARRINKVRVTLGSDDLYKLEFFRIDVREGKVFHIAVCERVHAESLRSCFTNITGMDCSL